MTSVSKYKERKIDFRYNLGIYVSLLARYKKQFGLALFFVLVLQASNLAEQYMFAQVVDRGAEYVAGTLSLSAFWQFLFAIGAAFVAIIAVRMVSEWLRLHLLNVTTTRMMFDLKRRFVNHLVHLSHDFHTTHKTGSMISRLMRGSGAADRLNDVLIFNVSPFFFSLAVSAVALAYFDLQYVAVILGTALVFIAYNLWIFRRQEPSSVVSNDTEDVEKANVSDLLTNIDSIQHFGKEMYIKNRYARLGRATSTAWFVNWEYFSWLGLGEKLILGAGVLALVYLSLLSFLAGAITVGSLVFIYTVFGTIVSNLYSFTHGVRQFYRSMADFQPLFEYGKITQSVKDRPGAKRLRVKHGRITFDHVDFAYKRRKIFKNFSLTVLANQKVAVVGPSGSGKSTLVKLLYRLYDVQGGAVRIDGRDIRDFTQESLRSELSIVPQECVLFDDTIYNNVAFSRPKARRSEVIAAMKFAQLYRIVQGFFYKERTIVGERGVRLSGGEKQRVSIARAILANKKILVLDEATSSLDSETERDIQRDLQKLMRNRTSIIIAHRLSTIMNADKIVVLDRGKIVQEGTHAQLIKKRGMYKKLWNLQKGGYIA